MDNYQHMAHAAADRLEVASGLFRPPADLVGQESGRPAAPPRSKSLAPVRKVPDELTAPEQEEAKIRNKCPEGASGKIKNPTTKKPVSFPRRLAAGGDYNKDADWEFMWPIALPHQTIFRHTDSNGEGNFLKPLNLLQLMDRKYSRNNMWPEEDFDERVRQLRAGAQPVDHGQPYKQLIKSSAAEIWLAYQMLQPDTRRAPLGASYLVPNWAKFFVCKRDRSVANPPVDYRR